MRDHLTNPELLIQMRESQALSLLSQLVQVNVGGFARCHEEWQNRVGLNIPQIKLLAIWVGEMHCVIVTKLCGAQIFGVGGFKHRWATTTPTTMATARRDTTKMTMATEYDDDGDDDDDDGDGAMGSGATG